MEFNRRYTCFQALATTKVMPPTHSRWEGGGEGEIPWTYSVAWEVPVNICQHAEGEKTLIGQDPDAGKD